MRRYKASNDVTFLKGIKPPFETSKRDGMTSASNNKMANVALRIGRMSILLNIVTLNL